MRNDPIQENSSGDEQAKKRSAKVSSLRRTSGLDIQGFADLLGVSVERINDWELPETAPTPIILDGITMILENPNCVEEE